MKFRTEVHIEPSERKIEINDSIFSIGSCFATEMAGKLSDGQMQTLNNPFGTLFNPFSVYKAIGKIHSSMYYREENLVQYDDEYISLDHHSFFNARYVHQVLDKINSGIDSAHQFLEQTKWVIITYGSSLVYEFLPKKKLVSNCHKIPQKYFERRFLTQEELHELIARTIELIKDICPEGINVLFTVSPVRHSKSGMVENQLSKSKLITALHEIVPQYENCAYLPVYEIVMDDLRDYRFYKEDLVHVNDQAVRYVWEKFQAAYCSEETQKFISENYKIKKALEHRVFDESNPKYQEFLNNLQQKITLQQSKVRHKIFSSN